MGIVLVVFFVGEIWVLFCKNFRFVMVIVGCRFILFLDLLGFIWEVLYFGVVFFLV